MHTGSECGQASGQRATNAHSSPASSIEAPHYIPARHPIPNSAALPVPAMAGNPLAAEPAWSDHIVAMQPTAAPTDSNPYLSSGSMYGDGDWLAGGINSHRTSNCSPSAKVCSHQAADSVQTDSNTQGPAVLQEQQNILPVSVSSRPILGNSCQPGSKVYGHQATSSRLDVQFTGKVSSPERVLQPMTAAGPGFSQQAAMLTASNPPDVSAQEQASSQFGAEQQYPGAPVQQGSGAQQPSLPTGLLHDREWQSVSAQQQGVSGQSSSVPELPPMMPPQAAAGSQVTVFPLLYHPRLQHSRLVYKDKGCWLCDELSCCVTALACTAAQGLSFMANIPDKHDSV